MPTEGDQHARTQRASAGYTLIELLEAIAAIALGAWLAAMVSSHLEGTWRTVIYWTIATAGSGIIFVCFLLGFGHLFSLLRARKKAISPPEARVAELGSLGNTVRIGKVISVDNGPRRNVEVRIARDVLFSEISEPAGPIKAAGVTAIDVVEERVGGTLLLHLYLQTSDGQRIRFYTGTTQLDIGLLLDELEASSVDKPRTWTKAAPSTGASVKSEALPSP